VDVLRWELCRLDLIDCRTTSMLIDLVRTALMQKLTAAGGLPLAVRVVLEGVCPIHEDLQARRQHWLEEFRSIAAAIGSIWLEQVKFRTTRKVALEELIGEDSPLYSVLQASGSLEFDHQLLEGLEAELAGLKAKIPPELIETRTLLAGDDEELSEVQKEVRELLIAGLLRQGGGE
jgi:hypothetical protein